MDERKRKLLCGLVVVLLIGIAMVQRWADPGYIAMVERGQPRVGRGDAADRNELMVKLPGQFIVASMAGFKEVIAGALWIRADSFFHRGNYQAIVPIVRLVTWLDPHNIDVYTTGAWHLDYNFVDEQNQLSDKRYIPASVALLKEGIRNNPDIYDLYFELGWTHFNKKILDYEQSLKYIKLACNKDTMDPNTGRRMPRPEFVDRMLAHAYEKTGRFDEAIAQWHKSRKVVEKLVKSKPKEYNESAMDICDLNLSRLLLRIGWRYGDMRRYKEGVELSKRLVENRQSPPVALWAVKGVVEDYAKRAATNNPPRDALKPLDAGFEVSWRRAAPKVLIIKGKINLCPASEYKDLASEVYTHWYQDNQARDADRREMWRDGSRVYWKLEDYDYKSQNLDTFDWRIDTSTTVQWDSLYVHGGGFAETIDLSNPKDAEMYPFKAKKYRLTVWVTPQAPGVPDNIQDRIGWKGEALTDKDESVIDRKTLPGFTMLRKTFIIDRSEIL